MRTTPQGPGDGQQLTADTHVQITTANGFHQQHLSMTQIVNRLTLDLQPLYTKSWTSPAGKAFRDAYDVWSTAQTKLGLVLQEIGDGLTSAANLGNQAEDQNQQAVKGAVRGLPGGRVHGW